MIDMTAFLTYFAIARNKDPDTGSAGKAALLTSMLNLDLLPGVLVASALANNLAPPTATTPVPSGGIFGRRHRRGRHGLPAPVGRARIRVPNVGDMSDADEIHAHLSRHRLRPLIHREAMAEIKTPRVLRQWPEADADVLEGEQINVLLVVPVGIPHAEPEHRAPNRK
jgi:hypothetical protein